MRVNRENALTIFIITIIVVGVALYTWSVVQKTRTVEETQSPAILALNNATGSPYTDLDGNRVSLTDFVGEVLVVSSWASWCPPCAGELKELTALSKEYEGRGVKVIGINRAEPANTAVKFLNFIGANQEIMLVLDPDDRYFDSIGGYSMPETVIYDRDGQIFHQSRDEMTLAEMKMRVDAALLQEGQN